MFRLLISIILGCLISTALYASDFGIQSSSFKDNETIPDLYTCNGKSLSPELSWSNVPKHTQSFVLILSSPDTNISAVRYLWVLYNIPADVTELSEGVEILPEGTRVGTNSLGEAGYTGPCPPDSRVYTYVFTLYALDTPYIHLTEPGAEEILERMKHHIIEQVELIGKFSH